MKVEALLPPHPVTGRRELLPNQRELLYSPDKYQCDLGGYGSGKSLAACINVFLLLMKIPGNRAVIIRRSYQKLHDSTMKTFMEVVERAGVDVKRHEVRDGWAHRLVFPNDSECLFRESKDPGRWLGPEYGVFYVDEAQEEPEDTFTKLMGRLRLPQAGKYLKGIITSNPPPKTHWIAKRFGLEPGVTVKGKSSFRLIRSSTRTNTNLPDGYLDDLLANSSESERRRIIDGEYGFEPKGIPVYGSSFRHDKHVGEPKVIWTAPLTRGWDFGYRHPAVTWHQSYWCSSGTYHWNVLAETDLEQLESEKLATEVIEQTKALFPQSPLHMIVDVGDFAGLQVAEKGPGPIVRLRQPPWNLRFRARRSVNLDPYLDLVRKLLRAERCKCGFATITIHRRCKNLIDGFVGGYAYPQKGQEVGDPRNQKPYKDGFYDDYLDSIRYVAMNVIKPALMGSGRFDDLVGRTGGSADEMAPEMRAFDAAPYLEGWGEEARLRGRLGGPIGSDDMSPAEIARWSKP